MTRLLYDAAISVVSPKSSANAQTELVQGDSFGFNDVQPVGSLVIDRALQRNSRFASL